MTLSEKLSILADAYVEVTPNNMHAFTVEGGDKIIVADLLREAAAVCAAEEQRKKPGRPPKGAL